LALHSRSLLILISQPSPSLVFLWILVYENMDRPRYVRNTPRLLVAQRLSPAFAVIQVAVIPFEIDVPRHVNLDDRAFPRFFPRMVISDVVFEQLDVIFANGRCKQLAESRARDSL
jgi:hypothetical protein